MPNEKWYLSTWFISLMFALWFLIVPGIIGIVLLVMQITERKKTKEEWEKNGFGDLLAVKAKKEEIEKEIEVKKKNLEREVNDYNRKIDDLKREIATLTTEYKEKKKDLIILEDELLLQSYGFYDPKYDFETSEHYKAKLDEIRAKQKQLVKEKRATIHSEQWTLDGSLQKGRAMNDRLIKLFIRSFNNECDHAISKVKFNNIQSIENRILKAFDQINKAGKYNKISIKREYLDLKLEELYLAYEYAQKKKEEQEEQRRIREQMREEAKVAAEIEKRMEKIKKEEAHFKQAMEDLKKKYEKATDAMKEKLEEEIRKLEQKLAELEKDKADVMERAQNTRAGYVYIISNIGSFGENVYKIGMTRRLEPMDRVKELSDASVPFSFDVHAMIFSEDAFSLERALHEEFDDRRVNKVNLRKEFFNVPLSEIEKVVNEKYGKVVEFTKLAEAEEYRQSLKIAERKEREKIKEKVS